MKNKIILILFLSILLIGIVSAEQSISQTSFIIKIYNNTLQIISNEYSGNNNISSFSIDADNSTNVTRYYVPYTEFNYSFIFVKNISVDISLVNKYTDCLNISFLTALDYTKNLTQCQGDINLKNSDIGNKQIQIDKLTKDTEDTKNQKFLFLIGGAIGAAFITLLLTGKIGRKVKSKLEEFGGKTGTS